MNKPENVTLGEIMQFADQWLTVKAVAKKMSAHPDTIRRWATTGKIKCIRHPINNYRLFLMNDLGSETLNFNEK